MMMLRGCLVGVSFSLGSDWPLPLRPPAVLLDPDAAEAAVPAYTDEAQTWTATQDVCVWFERERSGHGTARERLDRKPRQLLAILTQIFAGGSPPHVIPAGTPGAEVDEFGNVRFGGNLVVASGVWGRRPQPQHPSVAPGRRRLVRADYAFPRPPLFRD